MARVQCQKEFESESKCESAEGKVPRIAHALKGDTDHHSRMERNRRVDAKKTHAKIINSLRIRRSQATQESKTSGRQARQECNATRKSSPSPNASRYVRVRAGCIGVGCMRWYVPAAKHRHTCLPLRGRIEKDTPAIRAK